MSRNKLSRREFIKVTSATTAALALGTDVIGARSHQYDPKGLPTRVLGKTGLRIPLIGFGAGSRFCSIKDEDKALELLTYALDNGFYYWDTAYNYNYNSVISEERLGKILKSRRNEVVLSTKVRSRDPEEAKKQIETSLNRLNTDRLDELKIHALEDEDDLKALTKKGGVYDLLLSMREQGVTKCIGYSGHSSSEIMAKAALDYDFDTMLCALNHQSKDGDRFEEDALTEAAKKRMGIMVMKVIRPRETVENLSARDLIEYALSIKDANAIIVGTDRLKVLKDNIKIAKNFKPLSEERMEELRMSLNPFFKSRNLPWMQKRYEDGMWA